MKDDPCNKKFPNLFSHKTHIKINSFTTCKNVEDKIYNYTFMTDSKMKNIICDNKMLHNTNAKNASQCITMHLFTLLVFLMLWENYIF